MRARHTLAVVVALAVAGCDGSPTENVRPGPDGPVDPMTAQAASTGCSSRCAYVIDVGGAGRARVARVTEDAKLQGSVPGQTGSGTAAFSWTLQRGTVTTLLENPTGGSPLYAFSWNNWGQTVGSINYKAVVWEPSGAVVDMHDRATGRRVLGDARAVNEHSVVVGAGRLEGDTAAPHQRPYRYAYFEGVQYLSPPRTTGHASDVNNSGTIVGGYISLLSNGDGRWFTWTRETGTREMGPGDASAISDNGHIVGMTNSGRAFLYTPQGETVLLPTGWTAVDVNDWGEVLLRSDHPDIAPPGTCGAAVWYQGYGLLRLTSPVAGATYCHPASINSWGDVAGTVSTQPSYVADNHYSAVVWTWKGNAYRYVRQ